MDYMARTDRKTTWMYDVYILFRKVIYLACIAAQIWRKPVFRCITTLVLAVLLFAPCVVFPQTTTGSLTGTIYDPSGAAIPGATVTVTSIATGATRSVQTNQSGIYDIVGLMPNQYNLVVAAKGFLTVTSEVTITLGQVSSLDFHLEIGNSKQTITVNASESTLQLERASHEIATTLTDKTIQNLPANGRDVFDTLTAAPNVNPFFGHGGVPSYFSLLSDSLTLGGTTAGTTSYLQDGVSNFNLLAKTANLQPSIESTQEVSLMMNGASARYDEPSVVDVITKSGTNSFHGVAYDYLRNDALDAVGYFNAPKPPLRYNQFGIDFGGPIFRNKLLFFFDYAGLRNTSGETLYANVPGIAERAGDFSADSYTIYDPTTYDPATGTISPFPGNKIPANRISKFATLLNAYFPSPTPSVIQNVNYQENANALRTYDSYLGRLDYIIGPNDSVYGAYATTNPVSISPNFTVGTTFNDINVQEAANSYVEETHTFSSYLVNIARFGYNYSNISVGPMGAGQQDYASAYGIQNLHPDPALAMPPTVLFNTIDGFGEPNNPNGALQRLFAFNDEVNWTIGHHSIFMGGELDYIRLKRFSQDYNNGWYVFDGQFTSNHNTKTPTGGSDVADFLLADPLKAEGGTGKTSGNFIQENVMPYIQDDWKATSNLVLNLGLRYDFYSSPASSASSVYDVPTNTTHPGSYRTNYLNLAPRIGFAYAVNTDTVVHGGYGIYYTPFEYQELTFLLIHQPNFLLQSYTYPVTSPPVNAVNAFVANPSASAAAPFTLALHMPTPYVQEWNLSVQRSFGADWVTSISYLGSKFTHQQIRYNPNQASPPTSSSDKSSIASRRLYPWVGDVLEASDIGYANYNGLQIEMQRRMEHGFSLLASYLWSKSMDIVSVGSNTPENGRDIQMDYGLSDFNIGQTFKLSGIYLLPFGPGRTLAQSNNWFNREVIGGWQASGILTVFGGLPFSVSARDLSNTGIYHVQRANQICNGNKGAPHTIAKWFNTACFTQPAYGQLGDEQKNNLIGPRDTNLDLSFFKTFPFSKDTAVQFRSDFFNSLNHTQYQTPSNSITSPTFGQIVSVKNGRAIQMSVSLLF